MKTIHLILYSVLSLSLLSLQACVNQPNNADIMRGHAAVLQDQLDLRNQLADDHEKGAKLVATGEKRLKKGEQIIQKSERDLKKGEQLIDKSQRDLKTGQDYIKKANQEIREGNALILESERRYRENFPSDNFPVEK